MLVFSLEQLPMIFDIFISSRRPFCLPKTDRAVPANAIFLYARFAHYQCDQSWLEELIEGAVEKIEQGVYVSLLSLLSPMRVSLTSQGECGRSRLSRLLGLQHNTAIAPLEE